MSILATKSDAWNNWCLRKFMNGHLNLCKTLKSIKWFWICLQSGGNQRCLRVVAKPYNSTFFLEIQYEGAMVSITCLLATSFH